ncbi:site-specific integrase [Ancylobacter sp. 6x-1]|uniref:Site-specific integrase n=1 Tax=Ancylobacter crimeensis TaxID=2579147 RepID=A0ABT0DAV2_9HYPH|nr:DUF6538 domain-containing protein [Ancylobacter crimeensis]MCK0197060.1 site-specific integrase [Ancylobacter crimeensis]
MRREDSSYIQFRQRVPADLVGKVAGHGVVILFPAEGGDPPSAVNATIGKAEVKFSLRTRDPRVAAIRKGLAEVRLQRLYDSLRQPPRHLSTREVVALAGELYREDMALWEDNPASAAVWRKFRDAMASSRLDDEGALEREMAPFIDRLLAMRGLVIDDDSRSRLAPAVRKAIADAAVTLERRASLDYGPDLLVHQYPAWQGPEAVGGTDNKHREGPSPQLSGKAVSMRGLVDGWWQEAKAAGRSIKTHQAYSSAMDRLVEHVGHDDASRITSDHVLALKDSRLASGISPKTVKDSDLAGLKAVFGWAVANRRLASNPADGIKVQRARPIKLRDRGFTDAEAEAVLSAASCHRQGKERPKTFAAKRWVPWLCAYTGARVGEVAQLRKQDVRQQGDSWIITLTPEAGPIKNKEAREVPLHPHLVEMGFPDFVRGSAEGYLFLSPSRDGHINGPLQGLKNRLAEFGRSIVADPNVAPNHAWRHRFKTVGMEAGISERVLDAICGHAPKTVGQTYGMVTIPTKVDAIRRLPRYGA